MQKYLLLIFSVMFYLSGYGQTPVTITAANTGNNTAGTIHYRIANISGVKVPATGANKVWDYSAFPNGSLRSTNLVAATSFSPSAIADTNGFETISGSYGLNVSTVYDQDGAGYFFAGSIISPQIYSLYSITNNVNDSLFIPTQFYKVRQNYMTFPMTAGSKWLTNDVHDVNFTITATSYFLNKSPTKKRVHTLVVDTVAGWGTLRIPSPNKSSIAYNVLLVQRHTKTIDSFFLNGSPAPLLLLSSFSIKQGDTTDTYQEFFFRQGSLQPLLSFDFGPDDTYSVPDGATYDADNVESGMADPGFKDNGFYMYPNPAGVNRIIHINLNKTSLLPCKVSIVNTLGQDIKTSEINGFGPVNFSTDLSREKAGLYFVSIRDDQGALMASGKLELVK